MWDSLRFICRREWRGGTIPLTFWLVCWTGTLQPGNAFRPRAFEFVWEMKFFKPQAFTLNTHTHTRYLCTLWKLKSAFRGGRSGLWFGRRIKTHIINAQTHIRAPRCTINHCRQKEVFKWVGLQTRFSQRRLNAVNQLL